MIQRLIPVLAAAMLCVGAAADDQGKTETTFKSLDRDADQRLSKSEAAGDKMLSEHFPAADADSDGYITKTEYTAHMKEMDKGTERNY